MISKKGVAPYVGAWIETNNFFLYSAFIIVAPYVGAWIETIVSSINELFQRTQKETRIIR